jgi:hypothetical protein
MQCGTEYNFLSILHHLVWVKAFISCKGATMNNEHTSTWPELAIGLYDRLTGRSARISYDFDQMHVQVPSGTGSTAEHAEWVLNGKLTISTSEDVNSPN